VTRRGGARGLWLAVGVVLLGSLIVAGLLAPEFVDSPKPDRAFEVYGEGFPLGSDDRGIPIHQYAMQGAGIVALPSVAAGVLVMALGTLAGLVRCADSTRIDTALQVAGELVGALPRMVVVLVVALLLPYEWKTLLPIGLVWGVLAAPAAMDEAASSAGRLGGARFVEALRAHGFSAPRIYLYHVIWLNLRPVIVRQGAEVAMQVVFLEIALSYLALAQSKPSFTHPESSYSWATLLYQGYSALLGLDLWHAGVVGLGLVFVVTAMAQSFRLAARAR
jgi:peptide/nickel transport system permease protein